jgi:hypothetical protein
MDWSMRAMALAALILLASGTAFGQLPSPMIALAQLPDGTLSGNVYSNNALGVIFHLPSGWNGSLDPGHSVVFGKDPDGLANRCTRILERFESPRKVKDWFSAWGIVFAIDPNCLSIGSFPTSPETSNSQVDDLAQKIYQLYHPAPFFPPGKLDVSADRLEWPSGPVIIYLRGKGYRNVDEVDPMRKREPVPVNTEFVVTHGTNYWLGWAAIADDHSRAELARSQLQVKVP